MNNIKLARNILETANNAVDCTNDDYTFDELKELMQEIKTWLSYDNEGKNSREFENTLSLESLACGEVIVIPVAHVKEVLQDYLTNYYGEYILGCAYPSFLA